MNKIIAYELILEFLCLIKCDNEGRFFMHLKEKFKVN